MSRTFRLKGGWTASLGGGALAGAAPEHPEPPELAAAWAGSGANDGDGAFHGAFHGIGAAVDLRTAPGAGGGGPGSIALHIVVGTACASCVAGRGDTGGGDFGGGGRGDCGGDSGGGGRGDSGVVPGLG